MDWFNRMDEGDEKMPISKIKASFPCEISKVWETVTSLEQYAWRSDLRKVQRLDKKTFVEHAKTGFNTCFIITTTKPLQRWEFDIVNENMKGHWTGIFTEKNGITEIEFIEKVEAKKIYMKPFVKMYLKKQQELYIEDLRKALQIS